MEVVVVVIVVVRVLVTVLSLVPGVVMVGSVTGVGQEQPQLQSSARTTLQAKR
jgi:hypothetical protein